MQSYAYFASFFFLVIKKSDIRRKKLILLCIFALILHNSYYHIEYFVAVALLQSSPPQRFFSFVCVCGRNRAIFVLSWYDTACTVQHQCRTWYWQRGEAIGRGGQGGGGCLSKQGCNDPSRFCRCLLFVVSAVQPDTIELSYQYHTDYEGGRVDKVYIAGPDIVICTISWPGYGQSSHAAQFFF